MARVEEDEEEDKVFVIEEIRDFSPPIHAAFQTLGNYEGPP